MIYKHDYKPEPSFYKCENENDNSLFMGVELEVDCVRFNDVAMFINKIMGNHIYIKDDGSINDGFEIVSHPHTLESHRNQNWKETFKALAILNYNGDNCGLHIHINKNIFKWENIIQIVYFIERNWEFFFKFSRREKENVENWACPFVWKNNDGLDINSITSVSEFDKWLENQWQYETTKYRAVNLNCENTIEFRFFRGTLDYNTFMASLELIDNLVKYCLEVDNSIIGKTEKNLFKWIEWDDNQQLQYYLHKQGIEQLW